MHCSDKRSTIEIIVTLLKLPVSDTVKLKRFPDSAKPGAHEVACSILQYLHKRPLEPALVTTHLALVIVRFSSICKATPNDLSAAKECRFSMMHASQSVKHGVSQE